MREIEFHGSAEEMGRQHGELLGDQVREFHRLTQPRKAAFTDQVKRATADLAEYLEKLAPFLNRELAALGRTAGFSFEEALQLSHNEDIPGPDRPWPDSGHNCTVVIVKGPDGTLLANTMDISITYQPFFTLRRVRPDRGYRFVSIERSGVIGTSRGMNEKGLAIGGASAPYGLTAGPGLGLYVGMRLALQTCATVAEVVELFAAHRPPSKGHCYGLVDRTGAGAVIETNHDRMAVRPLTDRYLVAPNRFHAPEMIEFNASRGEKNEENCRLRERLLTDFLEAPRGRFDLNTAMNSLRLHDGEADGVCRHAYTRFGIVGQPEAVRFFLADGFPCQTDFQDVGRI